MDNDRLSPDKTYGPKLADLFNELCRAVQKECGASGVRVTCEFKFGRDAMNSKGKGCLTLKVFTTPDARTERMNPEGAIEPRGSQLQRDAMAQLEAQVKKVAGKREVK